METKKSSLSQKLLVSSFILLFLNFVLYKVFGEPVERYHSFGWYLFLIITILCSLSFAAFWIVFIVEMRSVSKKEIQEKTKMTKREKTFKIWNAIAAGSIFSSIILLILSISLCAGFKVDPSSVFKLSNSKEIVVFISEILTCVSILVAFAAPWVKSYWFGRKKMMNEP